MAEPLMRFSWVTADLHGDKAVSNLHKHEVYEMYFLPRGRTDYYVEGTFYKLTSGDMLIVKPEESHIWINRNGKEDIYEQVTIRFNPEAIAPEQREAINAVLSNRPMGQYNCFPASIFPDRPWFSYLQELNKHQKDISHWQPALTAMLQEVVNAYPTLQEKVAMPTDLVDRVVAYIHENLTKPLNMDMICQDFYISRTHLHRLFREAIGSSVWDYVLEKRLLLAKALLKSGEAPTAIYEKCGFNDYSSFYKRYVGHFGVPPQAHKSDGAYTYVDGQKKREKVDIIKGNGNKT